MSPYSAAVYDDSDFGRSLHGQVLGCLANDGIRLVLHTVSCRCWQSMAVVHHNSSFMVEDYYYYL
jgi:hypothetical protein